MRLAPPVAHLALASLAVLAGCPGALPKDPVRCDGAGCAQQTPDLVPSSYESSSILPPAWYDSGPARDTGSTKTDARALDAKTPPPKPDTLDQGRWYQANQQSCPTFCTTQGKANVPGPEGAHCMSGEARSTSGILQGIVFTWGCWPDCLGEGPHLATSAGGHCYKVGQKQDGDDTDRTVGCYCR